MQRNQWFDSQNAKEFILRITTTWYLKINPSAESHKKNEKTKKYFYLQRLGMDVTLAFEYWGQDVAGQPNTNEESRY